MKADRQYQRVPDISQARAKRILAPYLSLLAECVERAWARWWEEIPPSARLAADPRGRAAMVYCFIIDEARARFDSMSGVSIRKTPQGLLWVNIQGLLLVRFKKLDETKRGSNVPTEFQRDYTLHRELPHLPRKTPRLVIGYQLDRSQTKITDILVTFRVGDVVKWHFSARDGYERGMPVPAPLPFPATPTIRKARITAKKPGAAAGMKEQIRAVEDAKKAATENQKESSDR